MEEYSPEDIYGRADQPGAALEDIIPEGVLTACRGRVITEKSEEGDGRRLILIM